MSEPWLDVEQTARYLSVSTKTVRRHAAKLGGRKLGGRLLFRADLIDQGLVPLGPRKMVKA